MKVAMIACDNPGCAALAEAEWMSASGRTHRPPYGWLRLDGYFQGSGPSISVEVCSLACLEQAVQAAVDRSLDE